MVHLHHIYFGYVSAISKEQYDTNKDAGYTMQDMYGKDGIENVFEPYLRGQNGIRQVDMSVDGSLVNEYTEKEAVSGSNVVLTIDANLQNVAEKALQDTIKDAKSISEDAKDANAGAIVVMNVNTGDGKLSIL